MSRRAAQAALIALALAACSAAPAPTVRGTDAAALVTPEPGRPYEASEILAAMRDSRRPGGVPDELETERTARQIADAIWTIDGQPWETLSVGGSCGSSRCTLDVAGTRPDAMGEDVWTFAVEPGSGGSASVTGHNLGAVPGAIAMQADEVARASDAGKHLEGLVLASATWLPPPDADGLILAYRSGDEEGSCRRDVRVDMGSGEAEVRTAVDC